MQRFYEHILSGFTPKGNSNYILCTRDYSAARCAEIEHPGSYIRIVHFKNGGSKYFLLIKNQTNNG